MGFFSFLGKKYFYVHLMLAFLLTLVIIWGVTSSIDRYTRHGEVFVVPDFSGKQATEVINTFGNRFRFIISDSVYIKLAENGSIIQQDPLPGSKVKEGRNIYIVTVAQMPERIPMPNLRNLSLRQALVLLESKGLIANDITIAEHFARNAVVDQQFNGEIIEPGTEVFKGSAIDLIVGNGGSLQKVPIPMILGKKRKETITLLHFSSLNIGEEYFPDGYDTAQSRVFRTEPNLINESHVFPGTKINVYYRSETQFNFDELERVLETDSSLVDSLFYNDLPADTLNETYNLNE